MTNEDHSDDRDDLLADLAARAAAAAPDLRVVCCLPEQQRSIAALLATLPYTRDLRVHVVWVSRENTAAVRLWGPVDVRRQLGLVLAALDFEITESKEIGS